MEGEQNANLDDETSKKVDETHDSLKLINTLCNAALVANADQNNPINDYEEGSNSSSERAAKYKLPDDSKVSHCTSTETNSSTNINDDSDSFETSFAITSSAVKDEAILLLNTSPDDLKKYPIVDTSEIPSCSTSLEDFVDGFNSESYQPNVPSTSADFKNVARSNKSIEMQYYINKLREMVPYAKNAPKLSKVQLIHSTIDYITDLQEALEARVKRKKPECQNLSACRSPLSDLPVSQQLNSSNISDPPSQSSVQFTRHSNSADDLQSVTSHPAFEPSNDSSNAALHNLNQNIIFSHEPNVISKSKEPISEKTNNSPQSFSCIKSINQLFIRNIQEGKLKKLLINKVGDTLTHRTNVQSTSEILSNSQCGPSKVIKDSSINEIVMSLSHGHNVNIDVSDKMNTQDNNSTEALIKNNISNSESLLKKRKLEEL